MFEIWDEQTDTRLAEDLADFDAAREHLEVLLAATRRQVEATGASTAGMFLEWEIRDAQTGEGVGWHAGEPVEMPW